MMKGTYINVWIQKGAQARKDAESPAPIGGIENPSYKNTEQNEMVSIGFAPIEDRVDDLLDRYKIEYVINTESQSKHNNNEVRVLMQIFVPDQDLENILIGLQKAGVGVVAGTGFSLLPTTGIIIGEKYFEFT